MLIAIANAVARIDNLDFLSDVVPRTIQYKQYKEKKSREAADDEPAEYGQTTLDGKKKAGNTVNGGGESEDGGVNGAEHQDDESVQRRVARLDMEIRGGPSNGVDHEAGPSNGAEKDVSMGESPR